MAKKKKKAKVKAKRKMKKDCKTRTFSVKGAAQALSFSTKSCKG